MDGINNHYKELVISKIKELSEVYSSTIVDGVLNYFPDLDNTIVDIIKDLLLVAISRRVPRYKGIFTKKMCKICRL